ncbi:unnamed protein product [Thlaspi arvense]|uniref:DUF7610 domain-containing protein n=1 Tax=Thlaspi arvense TaxID=13288 RepID=A0AAU9RNY6_THLAR|nr:unnamed protein product [Thlaspi arvense]
MVKKRMKKNAKSNTILEKKLEEIECLLKELSVGDGDLNAYRKIQHRFIFTKTLLSAEISSVEDDEEEELKLACMAKRLTELEEAFDNQLTGPINESGGVVVNVDETGSVFSFVESLPGEFQDASLEKTVEDAVAGRKTGENNKKKNRFRGLVRFGIVGFVAGVVSYFGYFCDQMNNEDTIFPTAT